MEQVSNLLLFEKPLPSFKVTIKNEPDMYIIKVKGKQKSLIIYRSGMKTLFLWPTSERTDP